jgi:hypothetical protein
MSETNKKKTKKVLEQNSITKRVKCVLVLNFSRNKNEEEMSPSY